MKRFSKLLKKKYAYTKVKNKKYMSKNDNYTMTWIETPLSKFGFKCVMNKHDFCVDSLCECLCHHANVSKNLFLKKE